MAGRPLTGRRLRGPGLAGVLSSSLVRVHAVETMLPGPGQLPRRLRLPQQALVVPRIRALVPLEELRQPFGLLGADAEHYARPPPRLGQRVTDVTRHRLRLLSRQPVHPAPPIP